MASFTRNALCIAAVILLSGIAASSPANAQDSSRTADAPDSLGSRYRDPRTAQTLGIFIPGAGHIYAGEKLRGFGLGGAAVVGIASGIVFLEHRDCRLVTIGVESCDSEATTVNRINGITQLAVGVAAWVFAAIDAPRAAERANAQAQRRVSLVPVLRRGVVRQAALGLAVTVSW
jgi:hypothetical protein